MSGWSDRIYFTAPRYGFVRLPVYLYFHANQCALSVCVSRSSCAGGSWSLLVQAGPFALDVRTKFAVEMVDRMLWPPWTYVARRVEERRCRLRVAKWEADHPEAMAKTLEGAR